MVQVIRRTVGPIRRDRFGGVDHRVSDRVLAALTVADHILVAKLRLGDVRCIGVGKHNRRAFAEIRGIGKAQRIGIARDGRHLRHRRGIRPIPVLKDYWTGADRVSSRSSSNFWCGTVTIGFDQWYSARLDTSSGDSTPSSIAAVTISGVTGLYSGSQVRSRYRPASNVSTGAPLKLGKPRSRGIELGLDFGGEALGIDAVALVAVLARLIGARVRRVDRLDHIGDLAGQVGNFLLAIRLCLWRLASVRHCVVLGLARANDRERLVLALHRLAIRRLLFDERFGIAQELEALALRKVGRFWDQPRLCRGDLVWRRAGLLRPDRCLGGPPRDFAFGRDDRPRRHRAGHARYLGERRLPGVGRARPFAAGNLPAPRTCPALPRNIHRPADRIGRDRARFLPGAHRVGNRPVRHGRRHRLLGLAPVGRTTRAAAQGRADDAALDRRLADAFPRVLLRVQIVALGDVAKIVLAARLRRFLHRLLAHALDDRARPSVRPALALQAPGDRPQRAALRQETDTTRPGSGLESGRLTGLAHHRLANRLSALIGRQVGVGAGEQFLVARRRFQLLGRRLLDLRHNVGGGHAAGRRALDAGERQKLDCVADELAGLRWHTDPSSGSRDLPGYAGAGQQRLRRAANDAGLDQRRCTGGDAREHLLAGIRVQVPVVVEQRPGRVDRLCLRR